MRSVRSRNETPRATPAPQPQSDPAPHVAPQAGAQAPPAVSGPSVDPATIIGAIESLAGLRQRGILSDEEFAAKKADLLGRL